MLATTDIHEQHRQGDAGRFRQGAMKDRHQRRALAARRHVGGAKVIGHVNADLAGQQFAAADLHGQPEIGPVQHRLAVKANQIDGSRRNGVLVEKARMAST